jgi:Rrf2 family protein
MAISSKIEYALLALLKLASENEQGSLLSVSEIASSQQIPARYLDQILNLLQRNGIVHSQRGAKGGYSLARPPWKITLFDIVSAVEVDQSSKYEQQDNSATIEKTIIIEILQSAEQAFQTALQGYTLQDLCEKRAGYKQQNPMYYI